jgi:hypothetical protein
MFKKHRFTGDSVIITLSTPKVMEEVEEMMDVLEKALKEGPSINPALPLKNK